MYVSVFHWCKFWSSISKFVTIQWYKATELLSETRESSHDNTLLYLFLLLPRYNWYYHTLPQAQMNNRVLYWPRGRVWGGSSSLNAMVYIRGHAEDYNRWQREGAEGWDYEHCLPYFRKAQCHELGENRYFWSCFVSPFFKFPPILYLVVFIGHHF